MNITNLFQEAAKQYPNTIAIIDKDQSISYSSLLKQVKQTASYFHKQGIRKGDRVLVFIPMGIDLYRVVLALFYMGASAVFLDEWVSRKRLDVCCELADCRGFIGVRKARIYAFFLKSLRQIPIKLKRQKMGDESYEMEDMKAEDTALITFTTGSTGIPKAADRSHGFLQEQFDALIDEVNPKAGDVDMTLLPIVLFVNLGTGCTSVIVDFKMSKADKMDMAKMVSQIESNHVNRIIASPFFIKKLAEYALDKKFVFEGVKKVFTGGAPVFPSDASLFEKAFYHADIKLVYGSTEAEPISSIEASSLSNMALDRGLPVGKPYHKINLKIIGIVDGIIDGKGKPSLDEMEIPEGAIGEIVVAGKHVLKRYFKNELAFKENKIVVGNRIWHRTGDSGFMKDGQLYLTGRCKQLIQVGGKYLSPFIIEDKLQNMPDINMGTMLDLDGALVLVVESKLNKNQLQKRLADMGNDRLVVLHKIPRDPRHNTKIDYDKLKEMV